MNNGRPLSRRKQVQLLVILTILAWATQTLLHQWGYGQEIGQERFVPGSPRFAAGATLELRSEATVVGGEVKLKQVCRWSAADGDVFAPLADLVLIRMSAQPPFRSITVEQIKSLLHDAGVNLATINFAGATACTVARSDVEFDEASALRQWAEARQSTAATTQPAQDREQAEAKHFRSLREILLADLSQRLNLPVESLQISFAPQDEKLLNLSEPQFSFQIRAQRVRDLGRVAWDVTASSEAGAREANIVADARAWQEQLVVARAVAHKQIVRDEDLQTRRALVDRLSDDPLLDKEQAVGQQAARELKPGTVLTARMIEAVPLAKAGQFITILLQQGNVQVKTVAKALEGGSFGQTIRVRNETTKDVFEVVLTGPQTARMNAAHAAADTAGVASVQSP